MAKLRVHVQPGAKRDQVLGFRDGVLRVKVAAPPVEGRANKALVAMLAALLAVPKQSITIVGGIAAREKLVEVAGLVPEEIAARLEASGEG